MQSFRATLLRVSSQTSSMIIFIFCCIQVALSEKCYKNEDIGDRDGNVYYCESSGLPRCCVENEEPTCCESEDDKNLREQLQLWGMVACMIIVVLTLFICCKNDVSFCNSEHSLRERFQNIRISPSKKDSDGELVNNDQLGTPKRSGYYDNPFMGFDHGPGGQTDPYRYPPEPRKETPGLDPYI